MIGIDAAEARLIEAWTEDGTLPNLARLCVARGAYGRLVDVRPLAGGLAVADVLHRHRAGVARPLSLSAVGPGSNGGGAARA